MFRLFGGKSNSFRPTKKHVEGSNRQNLSSYAQKSLGLGDMKQAVALPSGEDRNEWMAANTVDFFNELSLIWGIVAEKGVGPRGPGEGFPPGFEYSWADGVKIKKPIKCSGPEYVAYVVEWVEDQINDEALFPTSALTEFPRSFEASLKKIYTRMFRVFAIVYTNHITTLDALDATAHLNSSFRHFIYFAWTFDLIDDREMAVLQELMADMKTRYLASA
jgi:MOB kinase activator 1